MTRRAPALFAALLLPVAAGPTRSDAGGGTLQHVEIIDQPVATYTIELGGTLDAEITRSEQDFQTSWLEAFQPNRFLSIENQGREPLETPRVRADGRGGWLTIDDFLADAITPGMSDVEKAMSLWLLMKRIFYRLPQAGGPKFLDPVVSLNTFGYGECVTNTIMLGLLAQAAGFEANGFGAGGENHFVTEIWWAGRPHMLDADRCLFIAPGAGQDLISPQAFMADHHIGRTSHVGWSGSVDSPGTYRYYTEFWDASYVPEPIVPPVPRDMSFVLRPGETLYQSWQNSGKYCSYLNGPVSYRVPPPRFGNGFMSYVPDFSDTLFRQGADVATGVKAVSEDGLSPGLHPAAPGTSGRLVFRTHCPYVIVGGRVRFGWTRETSSDLLDLQVSRDGSSWQTLWSAGGTGTGVADVNLDDWVDPHDTRWLFDLYVAFDMNAGGGDPVTSVGIDSLSIQADFQLNPSTLPSLLVGTNHMTYEDDHVGNHLVKVTQGWVESAASSPPAAPVVEEPLAGATIVRPRPPFRWQPATDPDGDAIADYEVQVSERADFHWPVSPNFDRYLSRTGFIGQTVWRPEFAGLLTPGSTYYWRVRARDAGGAWGSWSGAVPFTYRGIARPDSLAFTAQGGELTLSWRVPPGTARPASFLVYGADEQGFTPGPSSLVLEVAGTSLLVRTPFPTGPNLNRSFYRVVARDSAGEVGGASDYIELPHPAVITLPPARAEIGSPYLYAPLTTAVRKFDRLPHDDSLSVVLDEHPAWLALTGGDSLAGMPGAADVGEWPVSYRVLDGHGGEVRQTFVVRAGVAGEFTEEVPLRPGNNLISWPIVTDGSDPSEVLASVSANLERVTDAGGEVTGSLGELSGYWFTMRAADTLALTGTLVEPRDTLIPLRAGWNLVPFLPFAADSARHALSLLGANLRCVMGTDDAGAVRILDPALLAFSTLTLLDPQHGYWLEVGVDDTLRYPTDSLHPVSILRAPPRGGGAPAVSPQSTKWAALYGDGILEDGALLSPGAVVEVYDSDGVLCGSTNCNAPGAFLFTPVWEDDPATAADEGAGAHDLLTVRVNGRTLSPRPVYPGFGARIHATGELGTTPAPGAKAELRFASPAMLGEDIRFFVLLPEPGEATLDIHSILGRRVRSLHASLPGGIESSIRWDGRDENGVDVGPGLYLASLHEPSSTITRKIVLAR